MRLDKWLKVSRIVKRRTVANEMCDKGRVTANGATVKASYQVKVDDLIALQLGARTLTIKVLSLPEHVGKNEAHLLYQEV